MAQIEAKLARNSLGDIARNNSDKVKRGVEPKSKKVAPVVKSRGVIKKKGTLEKIKSAFIGDTEGSMGDFVLYDVIIPAFRNTMSDLGVGIVEQIFGVRSYGRRDSYYNRPHRSYLSYNTIGRDRGREEDRRRSKYEFNNIAFRTRLDAEEVLNALMEMTIEYDTATVRAFYELSGISETYYTDEAYGWTDLRSAYVTRSRDGWVIALPTPRPL